MSDFGGKADNGMALWGPDQTNIQHNLSRGLTMHSSGAVEQSVRRFLTQGYEPRSARFPAGTALGRPADGANRNTPYFCWKTKAVTRTGALCALSRLYLKPAKGRTAPKEIS